ncbi:trypsin-like serine protease [Hamadaea sp. NPDC051192]|uniref:trypsin-like serine protease n=1 Tax=Hamadaea sp. NPDC051192 TaxID=3154940 RepID=UPI003427244E
MKRQIIIATAAAAAIAALVGHGIAGADPVSTVQGTPFADANLRDEPEGAVIGTASAASVYTVTCYRVGDHQVAGPGGTNPYWDQVTDSAGNEAGWLADVWLNTGADINTQVEPCAAANPLGRLHTNTPTTSTSNYAGQLYYAEVGSGLTYARGRCTTGFAVTGPGDRSYLVTAGHCVLTSGGAVYSKEGRFLNGGVDNSSKFGTFAEVDAASDVGLIDAPADPRVADGPTGGRFVKYASGVARDLRVGQSLCVSGAVTGVRCGLEIVAFQTDYLKFKGMIKVKVPAGTVGACHGDSGGPAFVVDPVQPGLVLAVGTITGGNHIKDGGTCSDSTSEDPQYLYISPIQPALDRWHLTLQATGADTVPLPPGGPVIA